MPGWMLEVGQRTALLAAIPPTWPDVVADHVTLSSDRSLAVPGHASACLVGVVDDGLGVQAVIVSINDSTVRPDGKTFHVTWSLDRARGRRAVESNDVIAGLGWTQFVVPIPVILAPARI
jgi:hypothetical protein